MKKTFTKAMAAVLSLGLLTACGSNGTAATTAAPETTAAATTAAETTEAATTAATEAATEAAEEKFQASILFCGSTSLYPILSSLASSFTEEYVTWDKVDASFPADNISIYVAPA